MYPTSAKQAAQRKEPTALTTRKRRRDIPDNPATGAASRPTPKTNFDVTSAVLVWRPNASSDLRTHESGSSKILQKILRTDAPRLRPSSYHTQSPISDATTVMAKIAVRLMSPSPATAPAATTIGVR